MTAARPVRAPRPRRTAAAVLAAVLFGLIAALVPATPASAHAALVSATPVPDTIVAQAPNQVVLTFSEVVNPVSDKVKVIAPDGTRADRGEPRVSGNQLIIPLKAVTARGTYVVSFRVISADSHPVPGGYTFSVGERSATPADGGASIAANPFVISALPVARWIGYVGLLLLVGATLFLALLWPQRIPRALPTRVIWIGAGLIALSTVLELALQIPYVAGGGLFEAGSSDVREVLGSQYGAAHLIRLGVLGAALFLLRPIVSGKGWGADRVLLAVLGTIGVATWSVSGHPSASSVPMVTVVSDMVHVASMSVWLGGLVMLIVFLLPRATANELSAIIPVWSRWATYAISALILTGLAQALVEVGTLDALFSTTYGLMIVAKSALVALVLLVAAVSHRLVSAAAEKTEGTAGRLRRTVIIEAAIAVVILGVTSVLVQVTPARTASAQASGTFASVQSANMVNPRFTLTADVTPAVVGTNQVHLYATLPDGQPATILEWHVKAAIVGQDIGPFDATVVAITPDHATGQIGLPLAGVWTFTFELRTSEIDNGIVTAQFTVKG